MNAAIVMFAKAPEAGKVKTRLGATLGFREAALLHQAFITDLAQQMAQTEASAYLAVSPDAEHPGFREALAFGLEPIAQGEGDLGDRLHHVASELLKRHDRVLILGSDSPTLTSGHFSAALQALDDDDVFLGPSFDGGYYLIGLKAPDAVFDGIVWSTETVCQATVARCRDLGLSVHFGPWWYDVDEIEDLRRLRFHLLDVLCHHTPNVCPKTASLLAEMSGEHTLF